MRAVVCQAYGPPESLLVQEVPAPRPGPGEAVVAVRAAAVNFPDVLIAADRYQVTMPLPFVPGSELAGRIVETGPGAVELAPGERVYASLPTGAFAERAVVPVASLTRIPDGMSFAQAAAAGVTYRTAYHALRSIARVRPGQWVVVLGAAGGVGSAAADLARHLGARVVAAASGPEKLALCRTRGAEHALDYTQPGLKTRIKECTEGGADIVLDPVGGPYAEQALRGMRRGGTFVTLGYASGDIPAIPLNLVLLKGVTIRGLEVRTFAQDAPEESRRDMAELLALFAEGQIAPHIGARFPLESVGAALRLVAGRSALGKVVIDVSEDD